MDISFESSDMCVSFEILIEVRKLLRVLEEDVFKGQVMETLKGQEK